MKNCHDRVGQVRNWRTVCDYLASSGAFQAALNVVVVVFVVVVLVVLVFICMFYVFAFYY